MPDEIVFVANWIVQYYVQLRFANIHECRWCGQGGVEMKVD